MPSPFVAVGGPAAAQTDIENGSFWPAVSPTVCRDLMKLDGTVTDGRLRAALITGMGEAGWQLKPWREAQVAAGYTTTADAQALTSMSIERIA